MLLLQHIGAVIARRPEAEILLAELHVQARTRATVVRGDHVRHIGAVAVHVRQHDDRELQTLGRVDRDDTHDIVGLFADQRIGLVAAGPGASVGCARHVVTQPAREAAQPAAFGLGEHTRLVDHLEQVCRHLVALWLQHRELHQPRPVEHGAHQLRQRRYVPERGELAQRGEAIVDGRNIRTLRRLVVEPPAAGLVQQQLLVRAAECGRPQRRDRRHAVRRIVDRPQHRDQLAHLLPEEERPPSLVPVRDRGAGERVLVDLQLRPRGDEHGDVAPCRGALPGRAILPHRPAAGANLSGDQPGQRLCFHAPRIRGDAGRGASHERHGITARAGVVRMMLQRDICRLHARFLFDQPLERAVHPRDDLLGRAEVLDDRPLSAEQMALYVVVHRDIGAAEAVDRLLRIAYDEQAAEPQRYPAPVRFASIRRAEPHDHLGLQRVRILEFVDEDAAVLALEVAPHLRVVAHEVARPDQQIVEIRLAVAPPAVRVEADESLQPQHEIARRRAAHRPGVLRDRVLYAVHLALGGAAVAGVEPVLLVAVVVGQARGGDRVLQRTALAQRP